MFGPLLMWVLTARCFKLCECLSVFVGVLLIPVGLLAMSVCCAVTQSSVFCLGMSLGLWIQVLCPALYYDIWNFDLSVFFKILEYSTEHKHLGTLASFFTSVQSPKGSLHLPHGLWIQVLNPVLYSQKRKVSSNSYNSVYCLIVDSMYAVTSSNYYVF